MTADSDEIAALWQPDEWVCSHYQRSHFGPDDLDVWEHLASCYVDAPGYWDMADSGRKVGPDA